MLSLLRIFSPRAFARTGERRDVPAHVSAPRRGVAPPASRRRWLASSSHRRRVTSRGEPGRRTGSPRVLPFSPLRDALDALARIHGAR